MINKIWLFVFVVLSPIFFILLIKPVTFLVQRIKVVWREKMEITQLYFDAQYKKGQEYRRQFNKKMEGGKK